ncbi:MAG: DUF3772 domain-containing protein [Paracoccaceae bacterium]|nr:DUF3772 domain-containing protein [Paracoccaceae bacterium]
MRGFASLLLFLALVLLAPPLAPAQGIAPEAETAELKLDRWEAEAGLIEELIASDPDGAAEIDAMRATLEQQRAEIVEVSDAAEAKLAPLREQLAALGDPPEEGADEAPTIASERAQLEARIGEIAAGLKKANRADARAVALLGEVSTLRRKAFTRQLLSRSASALEPGVLGKAVDSVGSLVRSLIAETEGQIGKSRMDASFLARALIPLALLAAAIFVVVGLKRVALRRLLRPVEGAPHGRRVATAIAVTLVRLLIPALALGMVLVAAWNSGLLGPQGNILLRGLAMTLMVVISAYALGGAFYSPHAPQLRLSALPEAQAIAAYRWVIGLAAILGLDRVLVVHGAELGLSVEALAVLNTILVTAGGLMVWGITRYLAPREAAEPGAIKALAPGESEDSDAAGAPRPLGIGPVLLRIAILVARAAAIVAPALALMGYFAASHFVFYPFVFSGMVLGVGVLLFYAAQDSVEILTEPAEGDEAEAHAERPSRIRLIPIAVAFLLICAAIPVLALIWGADGTDLSAAWRSISDGFKVGEIRISPLDFFTFLLVFSIGYVLTRIVQGVLGRSVLPLAMLDTGVKAAITAGIGYVGIILSALVAISTTGLDLSNLAIVAGALSVGIGFGLQNVVNNFVSGIILLIERPIKNGDWVEIGGIHGTVQRVNVRSTEIQTFDRSTMFVPNADLISGTVTNWTHSNLHGRLIVKVGVAYGTDTRRVEEILLDIAKGHSMLLSRPSPYVLFRGFGADSLDFEIRGVLRDVNWILNVTSDINFEIARRFEEEGIEIPFAQRDLHIRNADELGGAIGGALRGGQTLPEEDSARPRMKDSGGAPGDPARDDPDGD